jgi:hypothetical protein
MLALFTNCEAKYDLKWLNILKKVFCECVLEFDFAFHEQFRILPFLKKDHL